ncbi:hypothetical protein ACIPWI_17280 [Streptomyces sp. NPDC090046]|uniref:hypothetical protein n=1 Tax=Streptomyces sp. NPDC090046 TaxID=3365928 RepID=UPI0037F9B371
MSPVGHRPGQGAHDALEEFGHQPARHFREGEIIASALANHGGSGIVWYSAD